MAKNLPSLNSIRFFEAAARHTSFTRAAEELFVTPGAVSKQIKLLEEQLECRLFSRSGPNLTLTRHGADLLATVSEALDIIQQGVSRIRRAEDSSLTLSVLPSFASIWLMPKIHAFEEACPRIMLRQHASFHLVDFAVSTNIDAAIRLGRGSWEGLYSMQLTKDRMYVVCSEEIASQINAVSDLAGQTFLIDPFPRPSPQDQGETRDFGEWPAWFAAAGEPLCIADYRIIDETTTLISAAMLGKGVALLREELITEHLASGALVKVLDVAFYSELHYFFVCPEERKNEEKIRLFHSWLQEVTDVTPQ